MADTITDIDNSPEVLSSGAVRRPLLQGLWL